MLSRKFDNGGGTPPVGDNVLNHIYNSADELQNSPYLAGIQKYGSSGKVTRCYGMVLDGMERLNADKGGNYKYRGGFYKGSKTGPEIVIGDNDNTIDSWNALDAAYHSEDVEVLYDVKRDGPIKQELLDNLPLYAIIGTGDVRGKYGVSTENPNRLSRHTIGNFGWDKDGNPLIYDLGKVTARGYEKYRDRGDINFIIAPKSKRIYFDPSYVSQAGYDKQTASNELIETNTHSEPIKDYVATRTENTDTDLDTEMPQLVRNTQADDYLEMMQTRLYKKRLKEQKLAQQQAQEQQYYG